MDSILYSIEKLLSVESDSIDICSICEKMRKPGSQFCSKCGNPFPLRTKPIPSKITSELGISQSLNPNHDITKILDPSFSFDYERKVKPSKGLKFLFYSNITLAIYIFMRGMVGLLFGGSSGILAILVPIFVLFYLSDRLEFFSRTYRYIYIIVLLFLIAVVSIYSESYFWNGIIHYGFAISQLYVLVLDPETRRLFNQYGN